MQKPKRDRNKLVELFGEAFSLEEMAEYLSVDKKWLREHHLKLGGIRLGRKFLVFETGLEREINSANFDKEEEQMAGLCKEERTKKTEDVSDTRTGIRLGGKREKAPTKKELLRRDKHGLLDTSH